MKNVYWRINKKIPEDEKKKITLSGGHLYKIGANKTDVWESEFNESFLTPYGQPLIPQYASEDIVYVLNQELIIKTFEIIEINSEWQFQYLCEDINQDKHTFLERNLNNKPI